MHSDEVQRLKSEVNQLKEDKLQIDSDLQQRNKLEEDKSTLLSENEQYNREIAVIINIYFYDREITVIIDISITERLQ
jgi:hypothetical protein